MEYQLTKGIQRSKAAYLSLALPSGHPDSLVTEGRTKGSMHRESPLVSSNLTVPEATSFSLKSSGSFYSQPSWTGSRAWPSEKLVASTSATSLCTPNVSRSHLPASLSSAQPTSYSSSATSGASDLIMMDSSGISSLSSKESILPDPDGELGENKGEGNKEKKKGKKTKLGKMYKQASRSTKAISRLFFHSPPSGGVTKRLSLKAPLPRLVLPEEDQVVDPFASGKSVASYGLSPVETSSPASHQRTNPTESQFLGSPSVASTLGISDSPLSRSQLVEGQSIRGRDIPFPLNVDTSSSMSLSPPVRRIRSYSASTTRAAKSFQNDNPPPIPPMPPGNFIVQPLSSPRPVFPPGSVTRPRANTLSETRFRLTVQPTKAVPMKSDAGSSSMNGGMQPATVITMRADRALAVQAQMQLSDVDSTVEIQHERVTSSPSTSALKGKYVRSSPANSSAGQRSPAGNIAKDMDSARGLQPYSRPFPPAVASGTLECVSPRRGSGSTSSREPSPPPYQQYESVTKPILPPLSTQNFSSSAHSTRSQQRLLPRSPSLPDFRPSFPKALRVPKLKLNTLPEVQRLSEGVHMRSPSLPTYSDVFMPQPLPTLIVDRLKLRGRDTPSSTSRLSSTDSVLSSEPPPVITSKAVASGPNPLTPASNDSKSVRRDAGFRALSSASTRPRPLAMHERKTSASEIISSTSRIDHTHITVHPSGLSIQSSALEVQSLPFPLTSLLPRFRRNLKSPSVPNLRARVAASSVASGHSRSQSSSPASPSQLDHVQDHSRSPSNLVPPIPPIPDNYKLQSSTNIRSETAPPSNTNFCRPSLNLTRPKEFSYPPTKKAEKLLHARFNKELSNEYDDADFTDTSSTPSRTPSVIVSSSPCRRVSHRLRPFSMKGQACAVIPPVPPLPPSPPISALPTSQIRSVPSRDRMMIGAAL